MGHVAGSFRKNKVAYEGSIAGPRVCCSCNPLLINEDEFVSATLIDQPKEQEMLCPLSFEMRLFLGGGYCA
jgi:hypothetical protein